MARRWKLNLKCTLLLIATIGLTGLLHGCDKKRVAEYRLGRQHRLVVYADNSWEVSQPVSYEVYKDNKIVIPETAFYFHDPEKPMPKFQLVSGKSVFGLAQAAEPRQLLIMHDISTEESWPHRGEEDTYVEEGRRREELLTRLNAEAKGGPFGARD